MKSRRFNGLSFRLVQKIWFLGRTARVHSNLFQILPPRILYAGVSLLRGLRGSLPLWLSILSWARRYAGRSLGVPKNSLHHVADAPGNKVEQHKDDDELQCHTTGSQRLIDDGTGLKYVVP